MPWFAQSLSQRLCARPRPQLAPRCRAFAQRRPRNGPSNAIDVWRQVSLPQLSPEETGLLRDGTLGELPKLRAHKLEKLASAMMKSGAGCSPPWHIVWRELGEAVTPELKTLSVGSLVSLTEAYSKVECRAPALFDAIAQEASTRLSDAHPSQVTKLVYSFARLGSDSSPLLLQAAGKRAASRLTEFSPGEVSTLMWSAAAIDVSCRDLFACPTFSEYLERNEWAEAGPSATHGGSGGRVTTQSRKIVISH